MKIIFLGGFFPDEMKEKILLKSKKQVMSSADRFQWALINGIEYNVGKSIDLVTAPFIGWFPVYYRDFFFREKKISDQSIVVGFMNLPLIKNVFKFYNLKKALQKLVKADIDTTILVYTIEGAYLKAAIDFKKRYPKVKICVIIPDLHEYPGDSSLIYKLYIKYIEKANFYNLLPKIDSFVVLTDKMVDFLQISHKPWVRVEGVYEEFGFPIKASTKDFVNKKIILYTGSLDFRFGIKDLLDAFSLIQDENYSLWICGGGVGSELIKKRCLTDRRITFFGTVSKDEVYNKQQNATLLINPRNNEGDFNKYSFPSKTMEYFASGTPTLMYRLDGVPQEYYDHCFIIEENSIKYLATKIQTICELDVELLTKKGNDARSFILNFKNNKIQTRKIVTMLEGLF